MLDAAESEDMLTALFQIEFFVFALQEIDTEKKKRKRGWERASRYIFF